MFLMTAMFSFVLRILPPASSLLRFSGTQAVGAHTTASLIVALRELRSRLALQHNRPVYLIFGNTALEQIAVLRPATEEALLSIKGIGPKNVVYAPEIFATICSHDNMASDVAVVSSSPSSQQSFSAGRVKSATVLPQPQKSKSRSKEDTTSSRKGAVSVMGKESLSPEQCAVLERVLAGSSTFITGSAGTGKSFLLRQIIRELSDEYSDKEVAVTASTGIAALNIGGQTIHSFAGIGLARGEREDIWARVSKNSKTMARWRKTKVLIVDEVSMLDVQVFDMLDDFAKRIRKSTKPFGGIQLVMVGDFLQLPPVSSKQFCFESEAWSASGLRERGSVCILREVRRQTDDSFVKLLNAVRMGAVTPVVLARLNECDVAVKPLPNDGISPTKLYCVNADVDKENTARLQALVGKEEVFTAMDSVLEPVDSALQLVALRELTDKTVNRTLTLKVGAQVMLMRNSVEQWKTQHAGLVNGQRGVVVDFEDELISPGVRRLAPVVRFDTGYTITVSRVDWDVRMPSGGGMVRRSQVPLKLAWAVTVHKSQGTTLSRAELMVANAFDYGQAYTALSRVTSLSGLWLTRPLSRNSIKAHPKVIEYYSLADGDI
jgi:ATP-dependent DNA helicase PIF1